MDGFEQFLFIYCHLFGQFKILNFIIFPLYYIIIDS